MSKKKKGSVIKQASQDKSFSDDKLSLLSQSCQEKELKSTEKELELTVTVVDHKKQKIGGATVEVAGRGPQQTNINGQTVFKHLKAGQYKVSARKEGYLKQPDEDWVEPIKVLTETAQATRTLHGLGTLRVEVCDNTIKKYDESVAPLLKNPNLQITLSGMTKINGKTSTGTVQSKKVLADEPHTLSAKVSGWVEKAEMKNVSVATGKTTVIRLNLQFPKLFIVGGGDKFDYAKKLAEKYSGKTGQGLAGTRKWVIVSQYDVTNFPGTPPDNLHIYRDTGGNTPQGCKPGAFSVTVSLHWNGLKKNLGADFEAIIFNNPHAGHALPKYDVIGVKPWLWRNAEWEQKTIFVREYNNLDDKISDYSTGSEKRLAKSDVFRPVLYRKIRHYQERGSKRTISRREYHNLGDWIYLRRSRKEVRKWDIYKPVFYPPRWGYEAVRSTMGLNEYLLWCFSYYGEKLLSTTGTLEINAPRWVEDYLPKYGFQRKEVEQFTKSPYYVCYTSNLTSAERHKSWGRAQRHHSAPDRMTRWSRKEK